MEAAVLLARLAIAGQQHIDETDTFRLLHLHYPNGPDNLFIGTAEYPRRLVARRTRIPDDDDLTEIEETEERDNEEEAENTVIEFDEGEDPGPQTDEGDDREERDRGEASEESDDGQADEEHWRQLLGEPARDISRNFRSKGDSEGSDGNVPSHGVMPTASGRG